jgi:hypothetical protein
MIVNTKVVVPLAVIGAAAMLFFIAKKGHGTSTNNLDVYVFDENGDPLNLSKRATVELMLPKGTYITKTTGITGTVKFQWIEQYFTLPAPYTLNVSLAGYADQSYSGTLNPGDNRADIFLQLA